MGVTKDDILVVHSSMKELLKCKLAPKDILDLFVTQLLPHGTLVCPTFPLYPREPKGVERLRANTCNVEYSYNVQKSRTWTGDLGRLLMKMPGARRSLHPLNTLTAYGKDVDQIFSKETIHSLDLPCGPDSPWSTLVSLKAKVLMIGVDIAHSLTMIHVAEDCYEESWPINNWYRQRPFHIINNNTEYHVTVRERHPKWSLSYAERKLSRDLITSGLVQQANIGSLTISLIESTSLISYLNARKDSAFPYYLCWLSAL